MIDETRVRRTPLSVARFSFTDGSDKRVDLDAARQTSRLIRSVDFACQASDGSILLACPGTDLRDCPCDRPADRRARSSPPS